jgi:phosphatidylglycerophosphatase A
MSSPTDRGALWLATGLGIGRIPFAPGTFGSLEGLALAWALSYAPLAPWRLLAVGLLFVAGLVACGRAAKILGATDPQQVVFDEIAAMPVVFLAVDFHFTTALLGFALFRAFDIIKPWPVGWGETLAGGRGIMADDLLAALYAGGLLWLLAWAVLPAS